MLISVSMPTKERGKPRHLNIIQAPADNTRQVVLILRPAERQFAIRAGASPFVAMARVLAACLCPPERCTAIISHLEFCSCAPVEGPGQSYVQLLSACWFIREPVMSAANRLGGATAWTQMALDLSTWLMNKYMLKGCSFSASTRNAQEKSSQRGGETKLVLYFANSIFEFIIWRCPVNRQHFSHSR